MLLHHRHNVGPAPIELARMKRSDRASAGRMTGAVERVSWIILERDLAGAMCAPEKPVGRGAGGARDMAKPSTTPLEQD